MLTIYKLQCHLLQEQIAQLKEKVDHLSIAALSFWSKSLAKTTDSLCSGEFLNQGECTTTWRGMHFWLHSLAKQLHLRCWQIDRAAELHIIWNLLVSKVHGTATLTIYCFKGSSITRQTWSRHQCRDTIVHWMAWKRKDPWQHVIDCSAILHFRGDHRYCMQIIQGYSPNIWISQSLISLNILSWWRPYSP